MLDVLLLGKTRASILRELYLNADRRISFNELVRRTRSGAGAVSREIRTLCDAGLVLEAREGNHRFLAAAVTSPVFAELRSFISKTSGAPHLLRDALSDIEAQISVAFIFGSVAQGTEHSGSDLDLFVIGSAGYSVVTEHVRAVENRLGRPVQVLYFDPASAADRRSLRKSSIKGIAQGKKLFVIGDEASLLRQLN